MPGRFTWRLLVSTEKRFFAIDGPQRAAAVAYYALFSLPSLLVLLITIGSFFVNRDLAARTIVGFVDNYLPLDAAGRGRVFSIAIGIVHARGPVGLLALLGLTWSSLSLFTALTRAVNRAWNVWPQQWWRMPLQGLSLLGITAAALGLGVVIPLAADLAKSSLRPGPGPDSWGFVGVTYAVPVIIEFWCLSLFYRLAPHRRMHFKEVWIAALVVTAALRILQILVAIYLANFSRLNIVYGAFGAFAALLFWIYISGWVIIIGSCLSAAATELSAPQPRAESDTEHRV